MAEGSRPPQTMALMAAAGVGGFIGTILAIVVVKVLIGPCCCVNTDGKSAAVFEEPARAEVLLAQSD